MEVRAPWQGCMVRGGVRCLRPLSAHGPVGPRAAVTATAAGPTVMRHLVVLTLLVALVGPITMVLPPLLLLNRLKLRSCTVPVNAGTKGGSIQFHVHGQLMPISSRGQPALSLGLPQQIEDSLPSS